MKSAQFKFEDKSNNSDGQLLVELMQALQATQKKAKENPKEAELNITTMSDNNGKRIIYNLTDQILNP